MAEPLQDILLRLADEIRAIDANIDALKTLLQNIHTDYFHPDEIAATQCKIESETALRATKLDMLQRKLEVYETRVVGLEQKIRDRKEVIDKTNPTPDLMDLFAQTQAQLNEELEVARSFLRS